MSQREITAREVVSRAITEDDANTTVAAIDIPPKTLVPAFGVGVLVTEALDGGTPALTVGDADGADDWVDEQDVTEGTIGYYVGTAANGAANAPIGKYYPSGGKINVAVSTGLTDGTAYVVAKMIDLSDLV